MLEHFFPLVPWRFSDIESVLDISSSLAVNFDHGEIRFEHAPLIDDSLIEINLVSSEADSLVVLIDKIDEDIGD